MKKVAILACTGMGQVVGTISRQIGYRVCDDLRPEQTVLVCLPALVKGVEEDIGFIQQYPVLVIEGCNHRCATHAVRTRGGEAAAELYIPAILRGSKVRIEREGRRALRAEEISIVEKGAGRAIRLVDELLGGSQR